MDGAACPFAYPNTLVKPFTIYGATYDLILSPVEWNINHLVNLFPPCVRRALPFGTGEPGRHIL